MIGSFDLILRMKLLHLIKLVFFYIILFFFPQVQCKWWIKQGGLWNREVHTSSMHLWRHPCAVHPALLFLQGNMSTITTPTPTMKTAHLHPGKPSMKFAHLQYTSITQGIGQVRSVQKAGFLIQTHALVPRLKMYVLYLPYNAHIISHMLKNTTPKRLPYQCFIFQLLELASSLTFWSRVRGTKILVYC